MNFYDEEDYPKRRRRRVEPGFWHQANRVLIALIMLAFLVVIGFMFYPVWHQQQSMHKNKTALELAKAEKSAQLRQAQRELELLRTNPDYVETIARDRLGLMKPNETIFRVELPRTISSSVQP